MIFYEQEMPQPFNDRGLEKLLAFSDVVFLENCATV